MKLLGTRAGAAALVLAIAGCGTNAPAPSRRGLELATAPKATSKPVAKAPLPAPKVLPWSRDDAGKAFDLAATKHRAELADLYQGKGVRMPALPEASLERIARLLAGSAEPAYPAGSGVLFYAHAEDELAIWLVDETGLLAFARVAVSLETMDAGVATLRRALGVEAGAVARGLHDEGSVSEGATDLMRASRGLGDIVLPTPIVERLGAVKHLIVVPTMGIGTIPLALLPTDDDTAVIDDRTVSVASSLFDLGQRISAWRAPAEGAALVVGNPTMPPLRGAKLPPLPGAALEARAVATTWKSVPLLGDQATESAVKQAAGGAELLHFATHAISRSERALDTGFLALAPSEADDGLLTGREVVGLPLRARLAVLSACQTGLGQMHRAGVIGLARAFQKARVPRVVMSLWNVDDQATATLMASFAVHLQREVPAVALRLATLHARERHPEPRSWAAFVMLGTPR